MNNKATLFLEDGSVFSGENFGATGESIGEIVFNTSMTGYQEILTDPSYYGQHVVMTYPLIGNCGINMDEYKSASFSALGLVVREYTKYPSHWQKGRTIDDFLKEHDIIGISEIDTRMITKIIRENGTMKALLTTNSISKEEALNKLKEPLKRDYVSQVTSKQIKKYAGKDSRVVIIDFGSNKEIIKELLKRGLEVKVVPYNTSYEEIIALNPNGIILSNGPGDPSYLEKSIDTIKEIIANKIPLFGISLGHQLLALASGAKTEKLKFGHRGGNHPVKDLKTERVNITIQNHGYYVTENSIDANILSITHIAVNDGTIEGLEHNNSPAFSVQYLPEASQGTNDCSYQFDKFVQLMKQQGGLFNA